MTPEEIVPYRDGDLRGECLAEYAHLKLQTVPWDTLKKQPDPRYRLIKASHTRRVISFSFVNKSGTAETLFAKRCRVRSLRKRVAHIFIPSKAKREWRIGRSLLARGVPTATPLLYAEKRRGISIDASYFVTREIASALSLHDMLRQLPYEAQKRLMRSLAQFIRTLHDSGVYHDDCNTRHVFFKGDPRLTEPLQFFIIDLDNARLLRYVPLYKRLKNLFQIMRSLPACPHDQRIKMALFDAYFARIKNRRRKRRFIRFLNLIAWLKREEPMIRFKRQ